MIYIYVHTGKRHYRVFFKEKITKTVRGEALHSSISVKNAPTSATMVGIVGRHVNTS